MWLTTSRYQRIYFYLNVARTGNRGQAYKSPEPDEDDDEGVLKTGAQRKSEWQVQQEQKAAEGKRPPLDPSSVPVRASYECAHSLIDDVGSIIFSMERFCSETCPISSCAISLIPWSGDTSKTQLWLRTHVL